MQQKIDARAKRREEIRNFIGMLCSCFRPSPNCSLEEFCNYIQDIQADLMDGFELFAEIKLEKLSCKIIYGYFPSKPEAFPT